MQKKKRRLFHGLVKCVIIAAVAAVAGSVGTVVAMSEATMRGMAYSGRSRRSSSSKGGGGAAIAALVAVLPT